MKRKRKPQGRSRPKRPPREGGPLTVFDLGRIHSLPTIEAHEARDPIAKEIEAERARWLVELAWDGHRVLACRLGDDIRLVSSDYREWADLFPTVCNALRKLPVKDVVIEGWLCAPTFEALRKHAQKEPQPITFAASDLVRYDGVDLRDKPLTERRAQLASLVGGAMVLSESLEGGVPALLKGIKQIGARGIIARDTQSERCVAIGDGIQIDRVLSAPPKITNRDKVMYPRDNLTKTDVAGYYDEIAPVILKYMADRPIVGQRWPDGIDDFAWYQHRMPPKAPDYLRAVWIEGNRRIVVRDRDGLVWLANQAVLTFHAWSSRMDSLAHPDWVVIDLDPGEKTKWSEVVEVAVALRKLLELLELPSIPKTSGQKGIHVLIPLAPKHSVIQAHELARRIAKTLAKVLPHLCTTESSIAERGGKLFVDHLQNFVGKTLVLPYSLRAADGAPVSAPLVWSEVTPALDPKAYSLRTLRDRLDRFGDLAESLLKGTGDIVPAIARLEA